MMTTEGLVVRAVGGDVDAFTELVTRYQTMAFAYAVTTLADYQLAEDATQQALLTAYRNLGSLREPARFGGWLRGIVRFECMRILRSDYRHRSESLDAPESVAAADPRVNVEKQAEMKIDLQDILTKMSCLPDQQRIVAQLYYLGDQSQGAVAEFLGLSVSTVNNRLRSARTALRNEGVFPVSKQSMTTPSFSEGIGKVLRANHLTIDAAFTTGTRPPLLTSVRVGEKERTISAFVAQYLDDDVARLIVTDIAGEEVRVAGGMPVHSDKKVSDIVVTADQISTLVQQNRDVGEAVMNPTGIKVIDLFAPLVQGGVVALVGASNVGKMVVAQELCMRLTRDDQRVTILVFLASPDELGIAHHMDIRVAGPVTVMVVPVADASTRAFATSLDRFDAVIAMSGELAEAGNYPAIDPLESRSSTIKVTSAATQARKILRTLPLSDRAKVLRAYLTQPFFVAEQFTGQTGLAVKPEIAASDLKTILHGDISAFDASHLRMIGALPQT